jgi:hypothetical protein
MHSSLDEHLYEINYKVYLIFIQIVKTFSNWQQIKFRNRNFRGPW